MPRGLFRRCGDQNRESIRSVHLAGSCPAQVARLRAQVARLRAPFFRRPPCSGGLTMTDDGADPSEPDDPRG